jgi:predicted nuclease with TOPRIM domain
MKEQLDKRLQALKAEFEAGQNMLADLETKRTSLKETLLRISGAIQVLEEELTKADGTDDNSNQHPEREATEIQMLQDN